MDHVDRFRRWPLVAVLLLVLLISAGLRLYGLPELPLGLHYDEAANAILAGEIATGDWAPVFIRAYTGKEVLFFYWASVWMRLAGRSVLALRLAASSAGLLTVAAAGWSTYELLHGRREAIWVAALVSAFVGTSFWHVVLSRYGFRAVTQPLLQALTTAALWRGLRLASAPIGRRRSRGTSEGWVWLALSGLFLGATAYTYLAARAFPIPLTAGLVTLLAADRDRRRVRFTQVGLVLAVAGLTLVPLAAFWIGNPGSFMNRTHQVAATAWSDVWDGILACLAMLFVSGDPYIRFNIPFRPLFGPAVAALFCLGLGLVARSCVRWVRPAPDETREAGGPSSALLAAYVFLLASFPVMILPSALAAGEVTPSNLRTAGLLPFIYVFPALGLVGTASLISRWAPAAGEAAGWVVVTTLLLGTVTGVAYFRDWAPSPGLYRAAEGDLVDVAEYLNRREGGPRERTFVASAHYRHPTLAFLARGYAELAWLTNGRTVVFPADMLSHLVVPASAADDLDWLERTLPAGSLVAESAGPDGRMAFRAYSLPASAGAGPTQSLTANYAHTAELLGYDVVGTPSSGARVDLAVWWRVLADPGSDDLAPVAHLVDAWGAPWGEASPFHFPGEQWSVGDVVADHLTIPVGLGAPPGTYAVRLSMYSAQSRAALPVLAVDGRYAGTWVELPIALASGASVVGLDTDLDQLAARLGVQERLAGGTDGLDLVGVNVGVRDLRPGARIGVEVFWIARSAGIPNYDVQLLIGDTTAYSGGPVHGSLPFPTWQVGQVVADRYNPRLPRDFAPGDYPLTLRLAPPGDPSVSALEAELGSVRVHAIERSFELPESYTAARADFEGQLELLGYSLHSDSAEPGGTISLTLFWRALTEMERDYTVFVHLVGPDESIVGQHDGQPVDGAYATSLWIPGEVVADPREVALSQDLIPGGHRIEVGVYVGETGLRLVDGASGRDSVLLQSVPVRSP
jgi:hypothetical protein